MLLYNLFENSANNDDVNLNFVIKSEDKSIFSAWSEIVNSAGRSLIKGSLI